MLQKIVINTFAAHNHVLLIKFQQVNVNVIQLHVSSISCSIRVQTLMELYICIVL